MPILPQGKYRDVIHNANGRRVDFGWRSNIVVDQCRELLAAFMLGGPALGIQRLDLGRGSAAWDLVPPPAPTAGTLALTDTAPVAIPLADLQLDYIDVAGNVTPEPQHRVQVVLNLESGDLPISGDEVFPLREFALFGELSGGDYMIDYVMHPVMNIGAGDSLTRTIRLLF